MIRRIVCGLAIATAGPVAALVQTGTITGAAGEPVTVFLPMLDGPGVYGVSLSFDRPSTQLITEFVVTKTYDFYCDFETSGNFEYCGGNDRPDRGFYREEIPGPRRLTDTYRIERPYTLVYNPFEYETGRYFADYAYFDYYFGDAGQVDWRLEVTRLADVPEPAAWTLMIAGFGLTGAALRRRRAAAA